MEAVSTIAAAIAALAALVTVWLTRRTVSDTRAMRADAARSRLLKRLEVIYDEVVGLEYAQGDVGDWGWRRQALESRLAGFDGLPTCRALVMVSTSEEKATAGMAARHELDDRIRQLNEADGQFAESAWPPAFMLREASGTEDWA